MKRNKRGIAWLLAVSMLMSTPGLQTPVFEAYAASNSIQENEQGGSQENDQEGNQGSDQDGSQENDQDGSQENDQGGNQGNDQDGSQENDQGGNQGSDQDENQGSDQDGSQGSDQDSNQENDQSGSQGNDQEGNQGNDQDSSQGSDQDSNQENDQSGSQGNDQGGSQGNDQNGSKPETDRIDVILPLQPITPDEELLDAEPIIYWNPGKKIQIDPIEDISVATPSNATAITAGLHPSRPVKSLSTAVRKAKKLAKQLDMPEEDMVIYAMNPMEIQDGEAYFLDGKGMTVKAWDGRETEDDLIFQVDGGQLTLKNVNLQPDEETDGLEDISLIQVDAGKVQLGEGAVLSGAITLNYGTEDTEEEMDAETATPSNAYQKKDKGLFIRKATPSQAEEKEENEKTETGKTKTRKAELADQLPLVELLSDFDSFGPFYLDVRAGEEMGQVELVRTMYADEMSPEEFLELFCFSNGTDLRWEMEVVQQEAGTLRKAGRSDRKATATSVDAEQEDDESVESRLTRKTLVARAGEGNPIYWNPGTEVTVNGVTYPAGNDVNGGVAKAPVKTWTKALELAKYAGNTVIVCVQTLLLDSNGDAKEFLGTEVTFDKHSNKGFACYHIDGHEVNSIRIRSASGSAIFRVEPETCGEFSDITFVGGTYGADGTQAVATSGGKIVLKDNVHTEESFLQIDLEKQKNEEEIPVEVWSENVEATIFFGGINDNLNKRFLDVVVPGGTDEASLGKMAEENPQEVGEILLQNITLADANQNPTENGYQWRLQQDGLIDDEEENLQNLELYTDFYYENVYLDGVRGNNSNLGASCQFPVQTWEKAKEILEQAVNVSVTARKEAAANNKELPPLPKTITICGTVTVTDSQVWTLPEYQDYDGTLIPIEVVAHTEIPIDEDGKRIHSRPKLLVSVEGAGASLTLGQGIFIRNLTDEKNSATVNLSDGAALTMIDNAVLSGEKSETDVKGIPTYGYHVVANFDVKNEQPLTNKKGCSIKLSSDWEGSIESRGIGVYAYGHDTAVTMDGGVVKNNKSYRDSGKYMDKGYGAGIVCREGAALIMNQGTIEGNQSLRGGAAVWISGTGSKFTMKGGTIQGNEVNSIKGSGNANVYGCIYIEDAVFSIEEDEKEPPCMIYDNHAKAESGSSSGNEYVYGGAITIYGPNAKFSMRGGTVKQNTAKTNDYAYGGGIYINGGTAEIHDAEISYNTAGVFGGGIATNNADVTITGSKLNNNVTEDSSIYAGGGGLSHEQGKLRISDCQIINNTSKKNGGGLMIRHLLDAVVEHCTVTGNSADNMGGGIQIECDGKVIMQGCNIGQNTALNGGGIGVDQYNGTLNVYGTNITVQMNKASKGGGIYFQGGMGNCQFQDTAIQSNVSTGDGGGIYGNGSGKFILIDGTGTSTLKDNQAAANGGGVYLNEKSSAQVVLNLQGENANQAGVQGHNVALMGGTVYLLSGIFNHPENAGNKEIYNAYLKRQQGDSEKFYMDPAKVSIQSTAQAEEEPNAIYLDSPDCYITYLTAPGDSQYQLPITLNKENFSVGSVVARPVGKNFTVSIDEFPEIQKKARMAKANGSRSKITYDCTTASDPSGGYHAGSITPVRTSLGGVRSNQMTNLAVIGQGIYLDGELGDNNNSGLSPVDAVKDFATAKRKLEDSVDEANNKIDGEGFSPFIYICGPVIVKGDETWNLEHGKAPYKDSRYETFEKSQGREPEPAQVKRFASFVNKPLVTIEESGVITADTLIVNGMKDAVITTEQTNRSPIFEIKGGTLNLNGEAVVRDNYYNLINMKGGNLNLDGTGEPEGFHQLEVRSHGYGVYAADGAQISMTNGARIYVENAEAGKNDALTSELSQSYRSDSPWIGVILATGSTMTMKDSYISQQNLEKPDSKQGYGIVMGAMNYADKEQVLQMSGNSSISYLENGIFLRPFGAKITLAGTSLITDTVTGILKSGDGKYWTKAAAKLSIQLMDQAVIQNSKDGISIEDWPNTNYGFDPNAPDAKNSIRIEGNAAVHDMERYGISLQNRAITEMTMSGASYIRDCEFAGIYTYKRDHALNINLMENTEIYSNGNPESNWRGSDDAGIRIDSNGKGIVNLVMKDHTKIYDNTGAGITIDCYSERYSKGAIIMEGSASVHGNNTLKNAIGGGVVLRGSGTFTMKGDSSITDNFSAGIMDGGWNDSNCRFNENQVELLENCRVEGNGNNSDDSDAEINLEYEDSKLRLADQAQVGTETVSEDKDTICVNGSLYLDGTAKVNGRIYLQNQEKPIVMTKHVPESQENIYRLHLAEGFVGQNVVIPYPKDNSYPGIEEIDTVAEVSSQLSHFEKTLGEGLAGDPERVLQESGVNIILSGENNVYLSGKGNDQNNGLTPATAVRTFKRAKELLEGGEKGGSFTKGANILITDGVWVERGDTDWGFEEGGFVTNKKTGDRWKPVVKAYEGFRGIGTSETYQLSHMIGVQGGTVSFHDITIGHSVVDGDKEALAGVLFVKPNTTAGATAVLGEGAIIENVQIKANSTREYPMIKVGINLSSVLILDGGIIQNCTYKNSNPKDYFVGALIYADRGHFIMRDGQILNNTVEVNGGEAALINGDTAYHPGKFEMSGGMIERNRIINQTGETGLIKMQGSLDSSDEIKMVFSGGIIRENTLSAGSGRYASVFHLTMGNHASITGGTIQDNQSNTGGAAIYYRSSLGKLEISGGLISNNQMTGPDGTTTAGTGENAAVYIDGSNFTLKGGGGIITDAIYLSGTNNPITLSGPIYQYDRSYTVYVNREGRYPFKPGSVVVRPDTVWLSDATPYLGNFKVMAMPYILDHGSGPGRHEDRSRRQYAAGKTVFDPDAGRVCGWRKRFR